MDEASNADSAIDSHSGYTWTNQGNVEAYPSDGLTAGCRGFTGGVSGQDWFVRDSNSDLSTGDVDWTWSLWFYLDTKTSNPTFVAKRASAFEYQINHNVSTDRIRMYWNGAASYLDANNFGSTPTGVWLHGLFWHDSGANTMNIRIRRPGVSDTTDSVGTGGTYATSTTEKLMMGVDDYSLATSALDGYMDQAAFWKKVLNSDEQIEIYNNGVPLPYANWDVTGQPSSKRMGGVNHAHQIGRGVW